MLMMVMLSWMIVKFRFVVVMVGKMVCSDVCGIVVVVGGWLMWLSVGV